MRRSLCWAVIIAISALLAVIVTHTGGMFRPVVVFWFLLICPGMAFVRLLRIRSMVTELTIGVAFSIALGAIVAETMVLAGVWSSQAGLLVLVSLSLSGAAYQIIEETRKTADEERTE
jgi:hypothetical protein